MTYSSICDSISQKKPSASSIVRSLLGATSVIGLLAVGSSAFAQVTSGDTPVAADSDEGDVVVATGFRQALEDALALKRNSDKIVDAISAEDIGKTTDQNIAEALQRITGVSIERDNGEGSTVTVRGVNADLNGVTLNGVPLTSSGVNQSVNFSEFSADVLQKIEVVKTPSASDDEGSLGAAIRLSGFKPLDSRRDRRSFEIQGRYSPFLDDDKFTLSDDVIKGDRKISGSFSKKLFDEKVGVFVSAASETQTRRTDTYQVARFRQITQPNGAVNAETGEIVTGFDYDGDGVIAADGSERLVLHAPQSVFYQFGQVEQDRDTYSATLQFAPTDTTDIQINGTFSQAEVGNNTSRFQHNPAAGDGGNFNAAGVVFDPNDFTVISSLERGLAFSAADFAADPFSDTIGSSRRGTPPNIQLQRNVTDTVQENYSFGGDIEQIAGPFTFNLRGGHSKSTSGDDRAINGRFAFNGTQGNNNSGVEIGFNCIDSGEVCPLFVGISGEETPFQNNGENFRILAVDLRSRSVSDAATNIFFDMDWETDFGPVTSLKMGAKWSERRKRNTGTSQPFAGNALEFEDGNQQRVSPFISVGGIPSNFGDVIGLPRDAVTTGFGVVDVVEALDFSMERIQELIEQDVASGIPRDEAEAERMISVQVDPRQNRDINTEVMALYAQANFELPDWRLSGDFGVRVIETDVDSSGFSGPRFVPQDFNGQQDNIDFFGSRQAVIDALGIRTQQAFPPPGGLSATNSYTNILPSLNVNWIANDDMIVRFAASQTMARPRIDDLQPNFTIRENRFNAVSTGTVGNPQLKPFLSTNFDASYEWYFDKGSLFSVALFNKDLKDFSRTATNTFFYRDIRDRFYNANGGLLTEAEREALGVVAISPENTLLPFDTANVPVEDCFPNREFDLGNPRSPYFCDALSLQQDFNGSGGYVRGVELSLQHSFTELPGLLGGLGFTANYTFSDSETKEEPILDAQGNLVSFAPKAPLENTSEHTLNLTGFYERDGKLLRVAYNKRTDYLVNSNIQGGYAHWTEGFDTLDITASWKFNDRLSLNFQGVNVTDTVRRNYATNVLDPVLPNEPVEFGANDRRTVLLRNTGPVYRLGIRYNW